MDKGSELVQAVYDSECIEYGEFTLKSGLKSKFYIDLRKMTLSSEIQIVTEYIFHTLYKHKIEFNAIGGPSIGADPIVGAYLQYLPLLRGFLIRSEEKDHGKSGLVIGSVKRGDKCVIVEDVVTTGDSLMKAVDAIEHFGCSVVAAISLLDRGEADLGFKLRQRNIKYYPLMTLKDLDI